MEVKVIRVKIVNYEAIHVEGEGERFNKNIAVFYLKDGMTIAKWGSKLMISMTEVDFTKPFKYQYQTLSKGGYFKDIFLYGNCRHKHSPKVIDDCVVIDFDPFGPKGSLGNVYIGNIDEVKPVYTELVFDEVQKFKSMTLKK